MSILNVFKSRSTILGENLSDFIISLGADSNFKELLYSTPKPMALRLLIDHIFVCSGTATYFLFLHYRGRSDEAGKALTSMVKRHIWHLENMMKEKITFNIGDIIVDEKEKLLFLQNGWKMNETTTVYTVFSVIGDYRMDKYSKAVGSGFIDAAQNKEGSLLTAKLLQESKNSCGENGFPCPELKLIYTNCMTKIMKEIN